MGRAASQGVFFGIFVLRRGPHESRILAGYYGSNANISFTFQAIKNLYAHPTYLCFGPFCKFLGDF